jgi:hypothetical protein
MIFPELIPRLSGDVAPNGANRVYLIAAINILLLRSWATKDIPAQKPFPGSGQTNQTSPTLNPAEPTVSRSNLDKRHRSCDHEP